MTAAAFAFGPVRLRVERRVARDRARGVGVAAAAAWWLADRAEQAETRPLLAPAALLAAALVWQASVSFYPGAYAFGAAVRRARCCAGARSGDAVVVGGRRDRRGRRRARW